MKAVIDMPKARQVVGLTLSRRMWQVFLALLRLEDREAISKSVGISVHNVAVLKVSIMRRLQLEGERQLVAFAVAHGLVSYSEAHQPIRQLCDWEKQSKAFEMREKGMSFELIAIRLGYKTPNSAHNAIQQERKRRGLVNQPKPQTFFTRKEGYDWEPWPDGAAPRPPTPKDTSRFKLCSHGHPHCEDWRGVHFFAIKFPNGRIWTATKGWDTQ